MARVEAQCVLVGHTGSVRLDPSATSERSISKENSALIESCARDFFNAKWSETFSPKGRDRLEAHRQSGHQLILVSGAPDFLITPLAETLNVSTPLRRGLSAKEHAIPAPSFHRFLTALENGS